MQELKDQCLKWSQSAGDAEIQVFDFCEIVLQILLGKILLCIFMMSLIIKWEGDLQDIPFGMGDMSKTLNRCGYSQGICSWSGVSEAMFNTTLQGYSLTGASRSLTRCSFILWVFCHHIGLNLGVGFSPGESGKFYYGSTWS